MKKTLISAALVVSSIVGSMSLAQTFEIPDPVAVIDGKALSKADFQAAVEPIVGVDNLEFIQNAQQLNELISQLALQDKLASKAKKEGLDQTAEYKKFIDHAARLGLSQAFLKKTVDDIKVTDEEIKAEYDKQVKAIDKNEYRAAHILVDTEAEAKDLLAKLNDKKKPLSFAEAAQQFSKDPGSKDNGGELGWFRAQVMVPEFGAALQTMKAGEVSAAPVKTQFGYHIISLEEVRETPIDSLEVSQERIKESLVSKQLRDKIEGIQQKMNIEYKAQ
ncbi:peptidylprolyl isomerase [Wohlfahrtiimonas larvae]|uniref:peptidylprolyl isomerase n=1 Tax=Wohlfahrtiimonas larvae TaxID=1157986 RepID=A0ABP9MVH6_9GAMM|nr:peptidylprolyl isomerase [Wohlfahrtiimonas larvae]